MAKNPPFSLISTSKIIQMNDVWTSYDSKSYALEGVNLSIDRGTNYAIVGQSGSGKSTFLRLLNREEVPDSGKIWVAGKDLSKLRSWSVPHFRRSMGCVFQDYKLLHKKTVFENVAFALEVIGQSRPVIRKNVPAILDLVGLTQKADRFPNELSGGEQQRVSIARAFANRPKIMLADEPTGNLDPSTSVGIMKLLDLINRRGTTVIMATHDRSIVDSMQRRVIELDRGVVVRDESRGIYD